MAKKRKDTKNDLTQARQLIKECLETQCTYLELGNCGITDLNDLPELFECTHLETLILSDEWIEEGTEVESKNVGLSNKFNSIPKQISKLEKLKKFFMRGHFLQQWAISDISPLAKLTRLQSLDISYTLISDISPLEKLTGLKSLYLSDNQISDISPLEKLTGLKSLYLSYNQISDISPLEKLTGLQYLDLDNNQISDISFLAKLTKLHSLYLSYNQISDISFLAKLTKLHSLYLSYNQISDISSLAKLTGLQYLDLDNNQISDISFLEKLTGLKSLYLSYNQISDISLLAKLTGLESLNLSSNQISDYSPLAKLAGLKYLYLSNNQISDISLLAKLTGLQSLNLSNNQISDINPLEKLTGLHSLVLNNNQIKIIPSNIIKLSMEITIEEFDFGEFNIFGNPIESPPLEILKQGRKAALDWFEATKKKLNEIKIILIGDPKAGKTSLIRRLKDDTFNENEVQTDGVNIEDIKFGECETFSNQKSLHEITGHFWDFGGQEIMNATHQFFLTNRSVYLLVIEARKDTNISGQIRDWIKKIKTTGGNSPVIVIANKADINPGFGFDNEYELRNEFPQIKYFIKTSCSTTENINLIKEKLEELIPQAEFFNTEIDETWLGLKEKLQEETKKNDFLKEGMFLEICKELKLKEKQKQKNAITFLHDLGIVLHFDEVKDYDYYILDPYWITYGVYQILTSSYAGNCKGKVNMNQLDFIINEEEDKKEVYHPIAYKKIHYTNNERRFLVSILNQFKLCFCTPDRDQFIIPDLLDTNEPAEITETIRNAPDKISFVYQYEYLPKSIMPNIIVETHKLLSDYYWRTGCVLQYNGCKALITNYKERISIIITGEHKKKRECLAVIRNTIDSINKSLSDKPQMLIPLPGVLDTYVDYDELLERERDGEKYYKIYKPVKKEFEISLLLEGVPTKSEMDEINNKLDIILGKEDEILSKLEKNYQYLINQPGNAIIIDEICSAIQEMNAEQTKEISSEMLKWLSACFEVFEGDLDERLNEIITDIKKTDNIEMKLKLGLPLINLLGIDFETKFDVKNWAKQMYKKHKLKVFKIMGY